MQVTLSQTTYTMKNIGQAYADIYIDAGADYLSYLQLANNDGTLINVANYTFTSQIRKSYYSCNAAANLVVSVYDEANGNVSIALDAANTANIFPGRYVYDIKMIDTSNVTTRIVEGIVTVTPQVTGSVY